jgi:hypothetical protein
MIESSSLVGRRLVSASDPVRRPSIQPSRLRKLTYHGQICVALLDPTAVINCPLSLQAAMKQQERADVRGTERKGRE